jgi:hypothetical protein
VLFWFLLRDLFQVSAANDPYLRSLAFGLMWAFAGVMVGDCFDTLLRGPGTAMELFWLAGLVLRQARENTI